MAILITGGTGKTSSELATLLQNANHPFLLTSRRGPAAAPEGMRAVEFDWNDEATHEAPFAEAKDLGGISAVYIVPPEGPPADDQIINFMSLAQNKHGVNRFVMIGGSTMQPGERRYGKLLSHVIEQKVPFTLIRATWFDENFAIDDLGFRKSIKEESKIYTCAGDGRAWFVAARDIAAVAMAALTMKERPQFDYLVLGPELITYDDVAARFTQILGRKVEHVKLTKDERLQQNLSLGMPMERAQFMVFLETFTADQHESHDESRGAVEKLTGKKPEHLASWVARNVKVWSS